MLLGSDIDPLPAGDIDDGVGAVFLGDEKGHAAVPCPTDEENAANHSREIKSQTEFEGMNVFMGGIGNLRADYGVAVKFRRLFSILHQRPT